MKNLLLLIAVSFSLNIIGQVPNYVPTNGLVGWWPFNGNANDESGIGNDGFTFGANTPSLQSDRFGNSNSAYYFYGENGEIKIPTSSGGLLLDPLQDSYSVSFWLKSLDPTLTTSTGLVLQQWGGNLSASYPFSFQIGGTSNILQPKVFDGVNVNTTTIGDIVFDDQWHMITMVKDNTADSIFSFADGVLIDAVEFTLSGPLDPIYDTIRVGPRFLGQIDDLSIFNRPLSDCEIQDLYNAQLNSTLFSVTQVGAQLTADQTGATYQWLDCNDNNAIINAETNQSYTSTITGDFAVEINNNGCIDTSACFLVDYTGLSEVYSEVISIYPNPASNKITINGLNDLTDITKIEITSITGAIVRKENITNAVIDISMLNSGMYLLFISHENGFEKISFLKE
ncbi:T9SS type A sorting domain-containing protein [Flavobacteriales bacterium]|nr:T9SS type A sorting domain-containing protein [Flavobacteriales bacterium]